MKKIIGIFLYLLLGWCFVYSLVKKEIASELGLESVFRIFKEKKPLGTQLELTSPRFSFSITDGVAHCRLQHDEHLYELKGAADVNFNRLSIDMITTGQVAPLLKCFHPQSVFISGEYTIGFHLNGSWDQLAFDSSATVRNGSVDNLSTGTHIENVQAFLTSDGKTIVIQKLDGKDAEKGTVTCSGLVELEDNLSYFLSMHLNNFSLIKQPHVNGLFSGDLSLSGNIKKTELLGSLKADTFSLALNEAKTLPKTIDLTYINQENDPPQQLKPTPNWPIDLDIDITSPKGVMIVDNNLNSEWSADLKLQGTSIFPLIYGSLDMRRGYYKISGKEVEIKEGHILFDGDPIKDSSLSVIGTLDTNTIIAEALVSGPLMNPNLTLRSNPPLPQADIFSHLVFGRGLADISSQQSKQLKKSIKDLTSMSTGANILDNVRNSFGIDRIEINRGTGVELEDLSLQIGKYLTRGIYVAFDKGITSATNKIILEASLHPKVKLQAEISDTAEGQLHLKWRHDY